MVGRDRGVRVLSALLVGTLGACAAPNLSRTVGKGNVEIHAAHGGPLIVPPDVPPVPAGHTNLGVRYGVLDGLDVDANLNIMPLAMAVLAMDVAAVIQLYRKPRKLAVSASSRLYLLGDLDDAPLARVFPEAGLHVGRPLGRFFHPYGGMTLAWQFTDSTASPPAYWTPFVAMEFLFPVRKNRQHGVALHVAWTNPWENTNTVVDYATLHGALAVYLAYRVRLGGLDR